MFSELEKSADKVIQASAVNEDAEKENANPFEGASQIQIQENLESLKLKQKQDQLNRVENINRDVEDLQEMYINLNEMVGQQANNVDHIEATVENAQQNVDSGAKELKEAHK